MQIWVYTLISVAIVSLISLVGVFTIALNRDLLQKIILYLVSFAVGALFGDAIIHLLPEAYETFGKGLPTALMVILGIFIFFVLEKFIRWRHCHAGHCDEHLKPVVYINLFGDAVHNFIDGLVIAASYSVSFQLGVATTIAVILHEIPQEIGDFGVLIHGGLSAKKALFFNFLSALASVIGAILFFAVGDFAGNFKMALIPITAGGFIYMAGSDLIPELHHDERPLRSLLQIIFIALGVAIMALMVFFE
ncbi:MAG: ZIP family metal transporter [Candidatus Firestonebacteria bacterium]